MAPPRWTTPEQLNFLTTKIPIYRDAQKNDATSDFLDQVYTEWFDKFPEPDSQGDGSDEKVAHRKYQIYNWLRNYSRVPKSNANFGHEDHDIHTAALRQCLKKCAQKTGYVFFVAAGGPHPRADGRLETFSISVPPTEDGESVSNVIGEFNGAIMTPFTTAVHRIFAIQDNSIPIELAADQPAAAAGASAAPTLKLETRQRRRNYQDSVSSGSDEFVLPPSSFKRLRPSDRELQGEEALATARSNTIKDVSTEQTNASSASCHPTTSALSVQPQTSPRHSASSIRSASPMSVHGKPPRLAFNESRHPRLDSAYISQPTSTFSEPSSPLSASADAATTGKRLLRPFPMSTQMLQSITPHEGLSRKQSLDGTDGGTKKWKEGSDGHSAMVGIETDEDEFFFLDPKIDPKDLCPYCDDLLPSNPTPLLLRLLATAKSASTPDVRPTNPLGRKATMTVYVDLCQRHRFESVLLPKARKKGWKEVIKWENLKERVEAMRGMLTAILEDMGDGERAEYERGDDHDRNEEKTEGGYEGPRRGCIFWREFMAEVQQRGSRGAVGISGQFSKFERLQPGYYGEQGSAIIYQTLCTMFPPASIDPQLTHPLTPTEFHQRILVPQVGLVLISEDLNSPMKMALKTMRDSAAYGVAMFPVDGDGEADGAEWKDGKLSEDKMGIADKIVLERARKRRRELEVEEREEKESLKLNL